MKPNIYKLLFVAILITIFSSGCGEAQNESSWQKEFGLSERNLVTTGQNKYFILEPGFKLVLKGSSGLFKTTDVKLEITVLNETKEVDGIVTRVVEEREWKNNELYEISRNFLAADQETGDIFYFGEEVDFYSDGKVINMRVHG